MGENEKRLNNRISSKNLISYVCTDQNDETVASGMGRTLNVSESGIMLETHDHIETDMNILLSIGLEEQLIDIKGKVVRSQQDDNGLFNIGIQFIDLDDEARQLITKFIEAFKS